MFCGNGKKQHGGDRISASFEHRVLFIQNFSLDSDVKVLLALRCNGVNIVRQCCNRLLVVLLLIVSIVICSLLV